MKEVSLNSDRVALVDDEDFLRVAVHRWYCRTYATVSYAYTHIRQGNGKLRNVRMHQLILNIVGHGMDVDHSDHNGLNNQKYNLRIATRSQNCANRRKDRKSVV